jgi:hypothetical protein
MKSTLRGLRVPILTGLGAGTCTAAALLFVPCAASAQTLGFSVSSSVDTTTSKYGPLASSLASVPLTVRIDNDRHSLQLTLPYQHALTAHTAFLSEVAASAMQPRLPPSAASAGTDDPGIAWRYRYSPAGDRAAFFNLTTRYSLDTRGPERNVNVDTSGYMMRGDVGREFGRFTPRVEAGYRFQPGSSSDGTPDSAFGAIGASYRYDDRSSVEVFLDARSRSAYSAGPERELSLYWSHRATAQTRVGFYAYKSLTQDRLFDAGVRLAMRF